MSSPVLDIVTIDANRRIQSLQRQLAARARIVDLGEDIMILVFAHLDLGSKIAATHTCVYWRSLALAHPLLWATVQVRFTRPIQIGLNALVVRSSPAPVELRLSVSDLNVYDIAACIQQHLLRVRRLSLINPPGSANLCGSDAWDTIFNALNGPAPIIEELEVLRLGDATQFSFLRVPRLNRRLFNGTAPMLQALILHDIRIDPECPLLSRMRRLGYAASYSIGGARIVLGLLTSCTNLEDVYLEGPPDGVALNTSDVANGTSWLPSLKQAVFANVHFPGILGFLQHRNVREMTVTDSEELSHQKEIFFGIDTHSDDRLDDFSRVCVLPPSGERAWDFTPECDIRMESPMGRTRTLASTRLSGLHSFPASLWDNITSLMFVEPLKRPFAPIPNMRRLESLTYVFRASRLSRFLDRMEPWYSGPVRWECPSLACLTLAARKFTSKEYDWTAKPVTLDLRFVETWFKYDVLCEVPKIIVHTPGFIVKGVEEMRAEAAWDVTVIHDTLEMPPSEYFGRAQFFSR
ncbi:hypothetical protein BKA62DRAFT_832496 [Auriculariales sp. MPI-PUGE-AT-0066]|nr:hypothetical protein BKA62DRAFT_832496 [Auriculariales sp. MPI-PUGE-AT-0066]